MLLKPDEEGEPEDDAVLLLINVTVRPYEVTWDNLDFAGWLVCMVPQPKGDLPPNRINRAALLDPKGRRARLHPGGRICRCSHRSSPPRSTLIPSYAGVSGMLAERTLSPGVANEIFRILDQR